MKIRKIAAWVAACLAMAAGGFYLARSVSPRQAGKAAPGNAPVPECGRIHAREKALRPVDTAGRKKRLIEMFSNCASTRHDWILRHQAGLWLSSMSTEELEAFAAELTPDPDLREYGDDWRSGLRDMVHVAWGLKAPASLLNKHLMVGVFEDWLARDHSAATAWLENARFPAGKEHVERMMKLAVLDRDSKGDFSAACRKLEDGDPAFREFALAIWAKRYADDPEKRAEILKTVSAGDDQRFAESIYQSMAGSLAEISREDAARFVGTMEAPEDMKQRLQDRVLGEWAMSEPERAFDAWMELGKTEVPKPLLAAMDKWSLNFPGVTESIKWVNSLQPGPVREQFRNRIITQLTWGERFPEAAALSLALDDPHERVLSAKKVRRQWLERYPEQAAEWFAALPPEDRDALESPIR